MERRFPGALLDAAASGPGNTPGNMVSVPGSFVYTPAAGSELSAGNQTLSVTFTPADTTNYTTATSTVTLNVEPGNAHRHLVYPGGVSPTARPWAARNWTPRLPYRHFRLHASRPEPWFPPERRRSR